MRKGNGAAALHRDKTCLPTLFCAPCASKGRARQGWACFQRSAGAFSPVFLLRALCSVWKRGNSFLRRSKVRHAPGRGWAPSLFFAAACSSPARGGRMDASFKGEGRRSSWGGRKTGRRGNTRTRPFSQLPGALCALKGMARQCWVCTQRRAGAFHFFPRVLRVRSGRGDARRPQMGMVAGQHANKTYCPNLCRALCAPIQLLSGEAEVRLGGRLVGVGINISILHSVVTRGEGGTSSQLGKSCPGAVCE